MEFSVEFPFIGSQAKMCKWEGIVEPSTNMVSVLL